MSTLESTATTAEIAAEAVPTIVAKLDKLNRKAEKLGLAPLTYSVSEARETAQDGEYYDVVDFTVSGQEIILNGWQFVGTLEHDEGTTIIRALPTFGADHDLSGFRNATPSNCDHCHYNRRRNDTYLVAHEDGTIKQVGSNCLKDFLGHGSPEAAARWIELVASFFGEINEGGHGSTGETRVGTDEYLTHVALVIRTSGWVSKKQAYETGETATAAAADWNLNDLRKRKDWAIEPTEADAKQAAEAIAWVRVLSEDELRSDYLYNLYAVVSKESIRHRQMGIAASAVSAYQREQNKRVEREARQRQSKTGGLLGQPGERLVAEITVSNIRYNVGQFASTLYTLLTADGESIKWFASNDQGWEIGDKLTIAGKIKKHEDGQYGRHTVVTHVKEQ
jgi:hypothetical protein